MIKKLIIVGSGIAGLTVFEELVTNGYAHSLTLISGEDRLPYKRTKVSKHLSLGFGKDDFAILNQDLAAKPGVQIIAGNPVRSINREEQRVSLMDGQTLDYDLLILATGVTPRSIGPDAGFPVYTARQAEELAEKMVRANTGLVIGGGILGIEVAEQLVVKGIETTLLSRDPVIMRRELHPRMAAVLQDLLTQNGVGFSQGLVDSLTLDGEGRYWIQGVNARRQEIQIGGFDLAVEAVGSVPNVGLAREAGLAVNKGIVVDSLLRTQDQRIWAVGDCAETVDGYRSHLWHAAESQGRYAARRILDIQAHGASLEGSENQRFIPGLFRTKCEVFDSYVFSIGLVHREDGTQGIWHNLTAREVQGGRLTDRFWYLVFDSQDRIVGINMIGPKDSRDKERSKALQQAVRQGLSRLEMDELRKDLSF